MCCNARTKVNVHFSSRVLKADRSFRSFDERMLGTPTQARYYDGSIIYPTRISTNFSTKSRRPRLYVVTMAPSLGQRVVSVMSMISGVNQDDLFPAMLPMIQAGMPFKAAVVPLWMAR
jgi:hypothetical protein